MANQKRKKCSRNNGTSISIYCRWTPLRTFQRMPRTFNAAMLICRSTQIHKQNYFWCTQYVQLFKIREQNIKKFSEIFALLTLLSCKYLICCKYLTIFYQGVHMDLEVALNASAIVLSTVNLDFRSPPFKFTVFYLSVLTSGLRQEGRTWLGCCCLGAEGESTNELSSSGLVFLA
jgi:hypothetical protein